VCNQPTGRFFSLHGERTDDGLHPDPRGNGGWVGVWGGGIGGGAGDGAACHAYALHGPSQRRSVGASLQRLLV
jgi:hypothetical protein